MNEAWIRRQWKGINLGDLRLNRRVVEVALGCAKNPSASLPQQFQDWADLKGAYRLFDHENVTHQKIQEFHYKLVKDEAARSEDLVLFIQDGSELLYNKHKYTTGLGFTADADGNGLMFHTCLVAKLHANIKTEIIGLGYQKVWVREDDAENNNTKDKTEDHKESEVWKETLEKIGRPPVPKHWVSVGDRACDIFEFLEAAEKSDWGYVVRAQHNRVVEVEGKKYKLFDWARTLTAAQSVPLYLRARSEEFSGEVELVMSWGKTKIQVPSKKEGPPLDMTVVRISCPSRPKLEWILLTNLPVESPEDLLKVVEIYRKRWLIEEYHKALKTGCQIEKCQMQCKNRLEALLGFMGIIATQLLAIKECCRLEPLRAAAEKVPQEWIVLVSRYFGISDKELTVRDFWRLVAKMGGFIGRKSDGEPGWQSIWIGFAKLQDMLLGAKLLSICG